MSRPTYTTRSCTWWSRCADRCDEREKRALGATPVLVTPLTRRIFQEARLVDDLASWASTTRQVATELKVRLLDLHGDGIAIVQAMEPAASKMFAQMHAWSTPMEPAAAPAANDVHVQPLATPKLSFDNTHLRKQGAAFFATIFTEELAEAVPNNRPLLVL